MMTADNSLCEEGKKERNETRRKKEKRENAKLSASPVMNHKLPDGKLLLWILSDFVINSNKMISLEKNTSCFYEKQEYSRKFTFDFF